MAHKPSRNNERIRRKKENAAKKKEKQDIKLFVRRHSKFIRLHSLSAFNVSTVGEVFGMMELLELLSFYYFFSYWNKIPNNSHYLQHMSAQQDRQVGSSQE